MDGAARNTILVVDDNADVRKALGLRLRANGYDVLMAADGLSATAAIVKKEPNLVILDLGLPCGDGFAVLERLQQNDRLAEIPVLVLTGRGKTNNMNRALGAGAAAFFQKPVEDGPLLLAIWKALDRPREATKARFGRSGLGIQF
jgi:DNA-binding response OmpR family regulator